MKRFALFLLLVVLVAGGMIGFVASRPVSSPAVAPLTSGPAVARESSTPLVFPAAPTTSELRSDAAAGAASSALPPLPADPEEAKARIGLLAKTFDEAYVPELAGYLGHASAEVRSAALTGLLLIDDASAIPYLRTAAEQADRRNAVQEAASLREAVGILSAPRPPGEVKMPKTPLSTGADATLVERNIPVSTKGE